MVSGARSGYSRVRPCQPVGATTRAGARLPRLTSPASLSLRPNVVVPVSHFPQEATRKYLDPRLSSVRGCERGASRRSAWEAPPPQRVGLSALLTAVKPRAGAASRLGSFACPVVRGGTVRERRRWSA